MTDDASVNLASVSLASVSLASVSLNCLSEASSGTILRSQGENNIIFEFILCCILHDSSLVHISPPF